MYTWYNMLMACFNKARGSAYLFIFIVNIYDHAHASIKSITTTVLFIIYNRKKESLLLSVPIFFFFFACHGVLRIEI